MQELVQAGIRYSYQLSTRDANTHIFLPDRMLGQRGYPCIVIGSRKGEAHSWLPNLPPLFHQMLIGNKTSSGSPASVIWQKIGKVTVYKISFQDFQKYDKPRYTFYCRWSGLTKANSWKKDGLSIPSIGTEYGEWSNNVVEKQRGEVTICKYICFNTF